MDGDILDDVHRHAVEMSPADSQGAFSAQLRRADAGRHAWLFLCGCFCVEGLVWGFPFSYGVFQQYYSTHVPFQSDQSSLPVIGTLASGIMYFQGPFVMGGLKRFPQYRRMSTVVGLAILAISLIGSSFATTAWQLILTQGILYAIGGSLLYLPTIMYLDEWFVRRKGLALGVMFAGTGVGGMVIPLVMNWGLQKYGVATTLRFWAVTMVVLCGPLLYYIKPRIPVSPNHRASRNQEIDFKFLKQPVFWFMQAGSTLQGIGYFIPTVYLPTYAASVGLSTLSGSTTIALLNASSILGQIALGTLSDHFPVTNILAFSALGSSLSIFLLWGLFSSTALLYVFALVYGLSAGGFSSCWAGMIREVRKKDPTAETGLVLGLLAAGRGIGCVICGPLSNALLREKFWVDEGVRGAYGSGYGPLVIFTGVTAILGGVSYLGKTIRVF